jgi:hypothetical protein
MAWRGKAGGGAGGLGGELDTLKALEAFIDAFTTSRGRPGGLGGRFAAGKASRISHERIAAPEVPCNVLPFGAPMTAYPLLGSIAIDCPNREARRCAGPSTRFI